MKWPTSTSEHRIHVTQLPGTYFTLGVKSLHHKLALIRSKVISASDITTLEAYRPCPDNSPFVIMIPALTAVSFIRAIISFNSVIVTSLLPLCLICRIWKYSRRLQMDFVKRPENVNRQERQFEKETKYSENLIIHA